MPAVHGGYEYGAWEPTPHLRIFGVGARLEQRWRRSVSDGVKFHLGYETQWRPVKHIYGEDDPYVEFGTVYNPKIPKYGSGG